MHRKRVTCELHDIYYRLMTIKHAIPKIEWAIELLYNSVGTGNQLVGDQTSWRQEVVGKATTQQKGPLGSPIDFGDETSWWEDDGMRTCPREAGLPALRLSSSPSERERHTALSGGAGEVNMLQSLFNLQLPLKRKPYNKVRGIFFKEVFARPLLLCADMIMHIYYLIIQRLECSPMAREPGFNPRSSHTKDSKNGTWCHLA